MLSQSRALARASGRSIRRIHTAARANRGKVGVTAGTATALALGFASYAALSASEVHNDAAVPLGKAKGVPITLEPTTVTNLDEDGLLRTLGWGTNRSNVLAPGAVESLDLGTPSPLKFLEGVALKDFALHGHHGACVDARGDVYQWGKGFFGKDYARDKKPSRTLRGKDITKLQVTDSRVFALSSSGRVYVLSAKHDVEQPANNSTWLWGKGSDARHVELDTAQKLGWGEKIVDISAGRDHFLALSSSGRTFALPTTLGANSHGQLGFRKFDVPDSSSKGRIAGELTPLAIADPYANTSRLARRSSPNESLQPVSESLKEIDDSDVSWSTRLFEIPALRGVNVKGIAAGARSSYALTDGGRVLAWGANDHGQLGLRTVVGDTVTVPSEVMFSYDTKCTSIAAGGDLAFFATEKRDGTGIATSELYACGDGRYGGLGTAIFTSAQISPARARAVSGLVEYSEANGNLQPITPRGLSVSSDGHVLCTLDTRSRAGPGGGGMDLLAWGNNYEHQLGNGRRSSVAVPESVSVKPGGARYMLRETRAREVRDLEGNVWGRRVKVEQTAYAGPGTSVVYWKVV